MQLHVISASEKVGDYPQS